jgi:AraC-like DNA-binding protein
MDKQFLQRALDIMEIHKSDTEFSSETYAREVGMSRSQLHRKLKALTGQSTGDFIRSYRLKYARQLIEKHYGNMTQVAYECGFNSPSYFAECFRKQFGVIPSEFAKASCKE